MCPFVSPKVHFHRGRGLSTAFAFLLLPVGMKYLLGSLCGRVENLHPTLVCFVSSQDSERRIAPPPPYPPWGH